MYIAELAPLLGQAGKDRETRSRGRQEALVFVSVEEAKDLDQVDRSRQSHPVDLEIDGTESAWESHAVYHLCRLLAE